MLFAGKERFTHVGYLTPVKRKRKPQEAQALSFLAIFVYATHATQAIAFEWKPGFMLQPN